jgi:hypothetical protein
MKAVEIWLPVLASVLMLGGHSLWRAVSAPPLPPTPIVIQFEPPIPRVTVEYAKMCSSSCGTVRPYVPEALYPGH